MQPTRFAVLSGRLMPPLRGLGTQVAWGIWPALASEKGEAGMGGSHARATERRLPSPHSVRGKPRTPAGCGSAAAPLAIPSVHGTEA